jgi:type II secretory pathway predicted ATPase ExeA
MYHAHFGLEHGLTGEGIAADADFFRATKHDRLIAHFKLALASPTSCIVLHGPAGVGKTTLTSAALRATSTRLAIAWLGGMATNSSELLELLLVELGVSTARTSRMERLQLWRQYQGEMRATDSRLFVVVERTEDLSAEVLHALDQLTAPDAVGNPGANVVLLGHASIFEHLATPLLDSLRQRIRLSTVLEPFTEAELQDYFRQQVASAGGNYERIFAAGAVAALHRYSRGVARLANTLCESALDIAAVQQQKQLTGELVAKTAVTLLGLSEPVPAAQTVAPAARPSAPPAEARPAPRPAPPAAPIFERRNEPRMPPAPVPPPPSASVSPPPPETRVAPPPPAPVPPPPPASVSPPPPETRVAPPPPPATPTVAVAAAPPPPPAPAATPAAAPPPQPVEIDFDGSITDVADVALVDFPVLTDAIEPAKPAPVPAKPAPPAPQAKAAPPAAATPAAAPKPAAKPASRVETAPPASASPAKPPAATPPTTTPLPHVAAAKAAPARELKDDDAARQTQTVRAIAAAKSLDEISDRDAETLFGDAELDLVSAALASAADWPDDDDPTAAPAPALSDSAAASPAKAAAPSTDDAFDLFGLDDNAPLELIDDSTLPPANPRPKTAAR